MQDPPIAAATVVESFPTLGKSGYQRLRAGLVVAPSFMPTLAILLLDLLLLAAVRELLRRGDAASFLLSQLLLAIVFFHAFGVLHECGHGSASRQKWLNTLVGHLASTLCFIPFYPWKYIHQKHHTWTGNIDRDPALKSLRSWRDRHVPLIVRAAWWSWIPLGALLQHLVYLTYPLTLWRAGELNARRALRSGASVAWLCGAHVLLARWVPEVTPSNVGLAVLLFLVAEEVVNLPHHVDVCTFDGQLPFWEQHRATRSCYYPPLVSELLVLNFNFHVEHHLFPDLPWYRLRAARALVKQALGGRYKEAVGVAWNLENRKRDLQSIVDTYSAQLTPTCPATPVATLEEP